MKVTNSKYKLLLIDSSIDELNNLESALIKQGFKVLKTNNGNEAIQLIDNEKPDMVITEINVPEKTGYDICRYIRNRSKNKRIQVLFLSSITDTDSILKGFQTGIDDYILKPYDVGILSARIQHQLSMFILKRTLIEKNFELHSTILARDKMYSVLAHDLRSPIGTVKMIMNLLSENLLENMVGNTLYKMICEANYITEDVFTLLDNLLKWVKNQTGNMNPLFQEIDLSEVSKGAVDLFRKVASVKNIQIEYTGISEAIVNVDIEMIKSCIRNLMSNAFKFSYENSKIIIKLAEDNGYYTISVQDFGRGMDEKSAQKLLKAKTHFTTSGTAQEEGLGLGLLLVNEMIEKNNGRLSFETKKDFGSTFVITIPKMKK